MNLDTPVVCPWCLRAGKLDDGTLGYCSVCFNCGMPAIVDDNAIGGLRKPTRREHEELAANPMVIAAMAAWFKATGREVPDDG